MAKTDVFVWMENEDFAVVSSSVRSLKKHLKAEVGTWFLVGPKGEKLERLGYDLGSRILPKPAFEALGDLAAGNGEAPHVLVWSTVAFLLSDWEPWVKEQSRLWPNCPATVLLRDELPRWAATVHDWESAQALGATHAAPLKETAVKTLPFTEYEKALKAGGGMFSPAVILLEKAPGKKGP